MQSTDFVPRVLQKEVAFSTLSLIGDIPGPKYELFSDLLKRVNDWLQDHCDQVSLVTCELIDNEGVYNHHDIDTDSRHCRITTSTMNNNTNNSTPAFLRVLRIWTINVKHSSTPRPLWTSKTRLIATDIVPRRLEACTGQRSPRFQRLSDCVSEFNQNNSICNDEVLCVRTTKCRFTSRHCALDTQRLFWLCGGDLDDVHTCSYMVVFSVRRASSSTGSFVLGFRDFTGDLSRHITRKHSIAKRRQTYQTNGQYVQALCKRATLWTQRNDKVTLLNLDTNDYSVNYKLHADKPSPERLVQLLDCPHLVNSLRSTTYRTKVVRVYYQQAYKAPLKDSIISGCKIFHSLNIRRASNVQFGGFYSDRHSLHGFDFDSISYHKWMSENVNHIVSMETTKIVVSGNDQHSRSGSILLNTGRSVNASDLTSVSSNHHSNFIVYSLQVYTSAHCKDLQPEPKSIRLPKTACCIL